MAQAVRQFSVAQISPLRRPSVLGLQAPTTSPGCCLCLVILFWLLCEGRPGLSGKCFSAELSPGPPWSSLADLLLVPLHWFLGKEQEQGDRVTAQLFFVCPQSHLVRQRLEFWV